MKSILSYFLSQNISNLPKNQWFIQDNKNRINKWYHAPGFTWAAYDTSNLRREYLHGLTRERSIRQDDWKLGDAVDNVTNWAIGFYNPVSAYTLGKVWNQKTLFPLSAAKFEENSVIVKLLFSACTPEELPLLKGTFQWKADIIKSKNDTNKEREILNVHLLQIDFAVKDNRSTSGWVFGTFVYDGMAKNFEHEQDFIQHFVPLGVNWNTQKEASTLNSEAIEKFTNYWCIEKDYLENRLRGPIDNPKVDNCMSCHMNIEVKKDVYAPHSYDYSLQLAKGIQQFNLRYQYDIWDESEHNLNDFQIQKESVKLSDRNKIEKQKENNTKMPFWPIFTSEE
ncbi:MAG: hypothetical protein NXI00_04460 [Cytophagales bacterium]|nr:hypothetical protein [Cytophagales bacterium]